MVPEHRVIIVGVDVAVWLMVVSFPERLLDLHVFFLLQCVTFVVSPVTSEGFQDSMSQSVNDQNECCDGGSRSNDDSSNDGSFFRLKMFTAQHFRRDVPQRLAV